MKNSIFLPENVMCGGVSGSKVMQFSTFDLGES